MSPRSKRRKVVAARPADAERRAIGYIRVSTDEQARSGLGLDAQRSAISDYAGRSGWDLVDVLADEGVSGKSLARPSFMAALALVVSGEVDVLMVAKLDRLTRSMRDFTRLMSQANDEGWAIVAIDLGVDMTTTTGRLIAHVMGSVAEWERDTIGDRTKSALASKKAQGVQLGRPDRQPPGVLEFIASSRASGRTLQSIADELNATKVPTSQGGARWYPSTVRAALAAGEKAGHT